MTPVTVHVAAECPSSFIWRRKRVVIQQITDRWMESGRWWDGELPCRMFEVLTPLGLFLLCQTGHPAQWYAKPVH